MQDRNIIISDKLTKYQPDDSSEGMLKEGMRERGDRLIKKKRGGRSLFKMYLSNLRVKTDKSQYNKLNERG